jgi:hypothetical protein
MLLPAVSSVLLRIVNTLVSGLDAGLSGAVGTEMILTHLGLVTLLSSVGRNSAVFPEL